MAAWVDASETDGLHSTGETHRPPPWQAIPLNFPRTDRS